MKLFSLYKVMARTTTQSIIFPTVLLSSLPAFAQDNFPLGPMHIRQDVTHADGVLVSRPRLLDEHIADFIDVHNIHSLEDYARWLQNNVRYQNDLSGNTWSEPDEFLNKRAGDCEDYASLTSAVLRVFGYQPRFLALKRVGAAHAICTFEKDGYYFWFDNAVMKKTKAGSFGEFVRHLVKDYNYSSLLELDQTSNRWILRYQRS